MGLLKKNKNRNYDWFQFMSVLLEQLELQLRGYNHFQLKSLLTITSYFHPLHRVKYVLFKFNVRSLLIKLDENNIQQVPTPAIFYDGSNSGVSSLKLIHQVDGGKITFFNSSHDEVGTQGISDFLVKNKGHILILDKVKKSNKKAYKIFLDSLFYFLESNILTFSIFSLSLLLLFNFELSLLFGEMVLFQPPKYPDKVIVKKL